MIICNMSTCHNASNLESSHIQNLAEQFLSADCINVMINAHNFERQDRFPDGQCKYSWKYRKSACLLLCWMSNIICSFKWESEQHQPDN